MLDVVDCEGRLDDSIDSVGGFDLVYDNGFVEARTPVTPRTPVRPYARTPVRSHARTLAR